MRRILGIVLIAAALAQFGFRGMQRVRSEVPLWDFASVYAAARTWTHGQNPYDRDLVLQTWRETGAFNDRDASYFATVYPPSSLLLLTPFAPLPAVAAMSVWLLLTMALMIVQFILLADMAGLRWRDPRASILVGASLLSAPFQFGILSGQLSMVAISLCIIAFWCVSRARDKTAGVLLGVACALKPQVGGPFLAFYLLLRNWEVSIVALLIGGVLSGVSIAAMRLMHINWLSGWMQSIAATQQLGGVNDYGWTNQFRDEIVDLKILLVSFVHSTHLLSLTVRLIVLGLTIGYLSLFPRDRLRMPREMDRRELILLATVWALSLLPIYHRIYDVSLLTIALAWALAELDGPRRKIAWGLLVPMVVFLVPFDIVEALSRRIGPLQSLARSAAWQSFIAPHYAWGLLAVTIMLLWSLARGSAESRDSTFPEAVFPGGVHQAGVFPGGAAQSAGQRIANAPER